MRKFTYKKNTAVIRTLKEPKVKKKKWNIDRVIYFIILILLLFWLLKFIYNKTIWIEGNGQVLMEKVDVNFTNDIRVKEIFINEGDTVSVGKNLFNYFQNDFDSDASIVLKSLDKKERLNNNLQDILKDILKKRIQLKNLKKRLQLLEKQEEQVTKLILLDVYTKNKLEEVTSQKLLIKNQIDLLKNELYFLGAQKEMVKGNKESYQIGGNGSFGNTYTSPIKGVIGQILKNTEESCYKSENVMTIHNIEKVFIKAYFNLKDLAEVKKGSVVDVEFPDKTTSKGIINKLYISTYKAPSEFQKKYEPTERNILAEIVPLSKEQIPEWGKFYKLNLKVKIGKL
ncbi:HlyD family efflux transporter periplasmic adaptor subunit [Pseudotenacibaculum sp. MALMAid0570]|uniref:HlyD family efflux transporter periplasmic adaptor subunit n=1 Tax=Pseudotenacibaculum sp. MALMAid0570 TaxID=3143938 RepID=UPI0032DFFD46